jgi:hypothetical protein
MARKGEKERVGVSACGSVGVWACRGVGMKSSSVDRAELHSGSGRTHACGWLTRSR